MLTKEEMPACPVATTVQLIGSKWKLLILRNLLARPWRFNELRKSLEGISQKVLTDSLRSFGFHVVEPDGTFYVFPRSLEPDAVAFCRKAQELDLLLVPGDGFGCPGHFRLSYCVPTEMVRRSLPVFQKLAEQYRV